MLPRTLVLHVFYHDLNSSHFNSQTEDPSLEPVFRFLTKLSTVSSNFRLLAFETVNRFFSAVNPLYSFTLHKSQLFLIQQFFPSLSFNLKVCLREDDIVSLSPLRVNALVCDEFSDVTEFVVADFICSNDLSRVQSLRVPFSCSESQCDLFVSHFSMLRSLYLDIDNLLVDSFTFPSSLSPLLSLSVYLGPRDLALSLDVSHLVHLKFLCIASYSPSVSLTGISQLSELESLDLTFIIVEEPLHPLVRLKHAKFDHIRSKSLAFLAANEDNFEYCKVCLHFIILPTNFTWSVYPKLTAFEAIFHRGKKIIDTSQMINLENLNLGCISGCTVDFSRCPKIQKLILEGSLSPATVISSNYPSLLKLVVSELHVHTVIELLKVSPFLQHLELEHYDNYHPAELLPEVSLNYLKVLRINSFDKVFPYLPRLPRLTSLLVEHITDFDFCNVTTLFPKLTNVIIHGSALGLPPTSCNTSVKKLVIHDVEVSKICSAGYLVYFQALETLDIITIETLSKEFTLRIPPNLLFLRCFVPLNLIQDSLQDLVLLKSVSGHLFVTLDDLEKAEQWLDEFGTSRPLLCSRLIIDCVADESDCSLSESSYTGETDED
ncbi:hypothetical protein RCL1_000677 [Eukaryota sp. TZLM3-RCL]